MTGLAFTLDINLLAAAGEHGFLGVWDIQSGELRISLAFLDSAVDETSQWLWFTPSGYICGSEGLDRHICWRDGEILRPAEAFTVQYYSPRQIQKALHQ